MIFRGDINLKGIGDSMKKLLALLLMSALLVLTGCGNSDDANSSADKDTNKSDKTVEQNDKDGVDEDNSEDGAKEEDNSDDTAEKPDNSGENELTAAFNDYVNSVRTLAPEEERLIGIYDSVTGDNYSDDETLYAALTNQIIPGYLAFIDEVEAVMPRNSAIREVHEIYIEAINVQNGAFTLMLSALEQQDYEIITEANEKLTTARGLMRDYMYAVEDLAAEAGVSLQ